MVTEYPEDDQRAAICHGQWRHRERDADMHVNQKLIEAINGRSAQLRGLLESGHDISDSLGGSMLTTADVYVQRALDEIGRGAAAKYFKCMGEGRDNLIKRAASTMVYSADDLETVEKRTGSASDIEAIIGAKAPMHAMMAIVNRLTTPSEDRDGDTLQTAGAMMDPKAPLLWQHLHTSPIGKMVRIIEQNKDLLKVATVLLDLNDLTSDAAKLVEAGALRFSHGFIPLEFEERKGGPYARFNVLKFEIVEESLVSVPSNRDAEIELFSRGKLTSEPFKNHAKALFDSRTKVHAVPEINREAFLKKESGVIAEDDFSNGLDKWNQVKGSSNLMRKMFDVATERLEPCTQEQDWAARYIGCSVKDMSSHETSASGMMIGAFLCGLEHVTQKYQVTDTRNMKADGYEAPPVHEVVEIKADERKTFLVEGIRFGKASDHRIVWRTWQGWGQQHLLIYTDNDKFAHDLIDKVWEWVQQNNPLKGQAFAMAGGWISKTGTAWEDVFLEEPIEKALKRTVKIINEKGAEAANRGIVLAGPPGTGKTLSARVILNEAKATYIWVSAKDFWKLGSYSAFAGAFSLARELAPSIICFEDVDNWIDSYTVDLLKGEMDGLQQSSGVTTILTTNFPDQLPAALIDRPGRFHDVLEIHLPTREVRLRMLSKWAADAGLDALAKMADDTDGYSGAHVFELCRFAKTLRDEDECSLDEALTKAFTKINEQRESINQSQLSGSSYRPGRRELEAAVAKGWTGIAETRPRDGFTNFAKAFAAKLLAKEMGECKGCGEKRNLNEDGYCAKCAQSEGADNDGDETPRMPEGASREPAVPATKAGRVLSQSNYAMLTDACDDMDEAMRQDMPRPAKALVKSAHGKVKTVCDSQPKPDPEDEISKTADEPQSPDHVLAEAIEVATGNRALRDRLRRSLDALDKSDELADMADMYRVVTSTG